MNVLVVTSDLATSTTVASSAARLGLSCATVWNASTAIERAAADSPRLVVLDLSTRGLDVAAVVAGLRELPKPPQVIAFGPHVHEAKLAAARDALCDEVVSRGRFHASLDELLAQYSGDADGAS